MTERSLFVELIRRSKQNLDFIRRFVQASQVKFSDKESGELFSRIVLREIEKIYFELNGFQNYLKVSTPRIKKNTVHRLIEEALEKYQVQLQERKISLSKRFEKDLPETLVPDEQLRYILDSVIQDAAISVPLSGHIGLLTRSLVLRREADEKREPSGRHAQYIEILLSFTGEGEPNFQSPPSEKDASFDLILGLVNEIVRRNRGKMRIGTDKQKGETVISLAIPVERRTVIYYPPPTT